MTEVTAKILAVETGTQPIQGTRTPAPTIIRSKWVGNVRARTTCVVKVLSCIRVVNKCGPNPRVMIKMVTPTGNQITWFTDDPITWTDDFVPVTFTVKEHNVFRGIKQTVVTDLSFKV